jgi:hypothetical protein
MRTCTKCGYHLNEQDGICTHCGEPTKGISGLTVHDLRERLRSNANADDRVSQVAQPQEWWAEPTNIVDSDGRPYMDLKVGQRVITCGPENTIKAAARAHNAELKSYYELLYAVVRKWPNESRHETALRYIQEAERCDPNNCGAVEEKQ